MQYNWKSSFFMTNAFCKTEKERLALPAEDKHKIILPTNAPFIKT